MQANWLTHSRWYNVAKLTPTFPPNAHVGPRGWPNMSMLSGYMHLQMINASECLSKHLHGTGPVKRKQKLKIRLKVLSKKMRFLKFVELSLQKVKLKRHDKELTRI